MTVRLGRVVGMNWCYYCHVHHWESEQFVEKSESKG